MANVSIIFKKKDLVADETWAFSFEKPEGFLFEAGQYVAIVVPKVPRPDPRGPVRSMSISSAPFEKDLVFTMRNTGSPFKEALLSMEPGVAVQITKPVGFFTLSHAADGKPIVFLIGGIGITPVRSILHQVKYDGNFDRKFVLFYANRFERDAAFLQEIKDLQLSNLTTVPVFSREQTSSVPNAELGYITEEMIEKYCPAETIQENWYYMVGAPAFVTAMEEMLGKLGVAKERMVSDPFTGMATDRSKSQS